MEKSKLSEDKKVDTLISLSNSCWTEYNSRRTYEWQVSFGLWTALGLIAGFAMKEDIYLPFNISFLIILLLLILFGYLKFQYGLHKSNSLDQEKRHIYNVLIHQKVGINIGKSDENFITENFTKENINSRLIKDFKEAKADLFKVKPQKEQWKFFLTWSHGSQILITVCFMIVLFLIFSNKVSRQGSDSKCPYKHKVEFKN